MRVVVREHRLHELERIDDSAVGDGLIEGILRFAGTENVVLDVRMGDVVSFARDIGSERPDVEEPGTASLARVQWPTWLVCTRWRKAGGRAAAQASSRSRLGLDLRATNPSIPSGYQCEKLARSAGVEFPQQSHKLGPIFLSNSVVAVGTVSEYFQRNVG